MKKRLLSGLLALIILLTCFATSVFADSPLPFVDIKEGSWCYDAISFCYENGLMVGVSSTKFGPNTTCSRAMIASVLYRLSDTPAVEYSKEFSDVPDGKWFSDAVVWCAKNGLVAGYGNGKFGPNDAITREQLVTLMYRYAAFCGCNVTAAVSLTQYKDEKDISSFARRAFSWANADGLISGQPGPKLAPKATATRAELAAVLVNLYTYINTPEATCSNYRIHTDSLWSTDGGWMVGTGSSYVWAGENGNDAKYNTSIVDNSISIVSAGSRDVNLLYTNYEPQDCGASLGNSKLHLKVYVSDDAWLFNTWCVFEIGSGKDGWIGNNNLRWQINRNVISQPGWNEITLNFKDAFSTSGTFKPEEFKYLWFAATNVPRGVKICLSDVYITGDPLCNHEKCPACGGCLDENCACDIPGCCTPCICHPEPICTHEKCLVCGGCTVENCDCEIPGCCTPCTCPVPETVYAISADGFYGEDGAWRVWTGSEYAVLADKGNAEYYRVSVDEVDNREGSGAMQIISAQDRDTGLMYLLYEDEDVSMENGRLSFDFYISDASYISNWNNVQLASSWINDNALAWILTDGQIQNGWNHITLDFADAETIGTFDMSLLKLFWLSIVGLPDDVVIKLDNIRLIGIPTEKCEHTKCPVCGGCLEESCECALGDCYPCSCVPPCDHEKCRICGGCMVEDCDHTDDCCAVKCPGEGNHPRDISFTAPNIWCYWTEEGHDHLENGLDLSETPLGYMDGERKYLCNLGVSCVEDGEGNKRLWSIFNSGDTNERSGNYIALVTSVDDGESWTELSAIIEHPDSEVCCADGTLWTDPDGRLWVFWTQEYLAVPWRNYDYSVDNQGLNEDGSLHADALRGVWCTYSENAYDEHPTFSEPVRLCDGMIINDPCVATIEGEQTILINPYMCSWIAEDDCSDPTTKGPTLYTLDIDENGVPYATYYSRIMENPYENYSTFRNYCEPMTVQTSDGGLMMVVRTDKGIEVTRTTDPLTAAPYTGGWTELDYIRNGDAIMTKTASRPNLIKLDDGSLLFIYHDILTAARVNLTVARSTDDGYTWEQKLLLDSRSVSYPDTAVASDGTIYVQYDFDRYGLQNVYLTKLTVEDIIAGEPVSDVYVKNLLVNGNDYNKPFADSTQVALTNGRWFATNAHSGGYKQVGENTTAYATLTDGTLNLVSDGTESPTGAVYLTTGSNFIDSGMTIEDGALVFDIYVSDYTSFVSKWGIVEIGDNNSWVGADMGNVLVWNMRNVIYQNGWNTVWLNLKDALAEGEIDLSHIGSFWFYSNQVSEGVEIKVRNVRFAQREEGLPEKKIAPNSDNVKLLGRTMAENDVIWMPYSASGIEFEVDATDLAIMLTADGGYANGIDSAPRFAILLDGEIVLDTQLQAKEKTYRIFSSENARKATVTVLKLSEAAHSAIGVKNILLDENGSVTPTDDKQLKIEFIGDSITCGYGIDDEDYNHGFSTSTENVMKTYAYKTAQELDADCSFVAYSGYGIVSGYTPMQGVKAESLTVPPIYEYFAKTSAAEAQCLGGTAQWDFSRFVPDYIVINLGTNDFSYTGNDSSLISEFKENYITFIAQVRKNNPNAHIICALGIMREDLCDSVKQAVTEYALATGDTNISSLQFATQDGSLGYAADWHPTERTNEQAAQLLIQHIRNLQEPHCDHEKCVMCGGCLEENCNCELEGCCYPCTCVHSYTIEKFKLLMPVDNETSWVTGGRWCAATNKSTTWNSANNVFNAADKVLTNAENGELILTVDNDKTNGGGRNSGLLYLDTTGTGFDSGITAYAGVLTFDIYLTDAEAFKEGGATVELADTNYKNALWINDGNRLHWDISTLYLHNGWNTLALNLSDAERIATEKTDTDTNFDTTSVGYFWVYSLNQPNGSKIGVRNVIFAERADLHYAYNLATNTGWVSENGQTKHWAVNLLTNDNTYAYVMYDTGAEGTYGEGGSVWFEDGAIVLKGYGNEASTGALLYERTPDTSYDLRGITMQSGLLKMDIYVESLEALGNEWSTVSLSSGEWVGADTEISWNIRSYLYQDGWNTVYLPFEEASVGEHFDISNIRLFWFAMNGVPTNSYLKLANISIINTVEET